MIINLHITSLHVRCRQKTQANKITRSPDINIPEST